MKHRIDQLNDILQSLFINELANTHPVMKNKDYVALQDILIDATAISTSRTLYPTILKSYEHFLAKGKGQVPTITAENDITEVKAKMKAIEVDTNKLIVRAKDYLQNQAQIHGDDQAYLKEVNKALFKVKQLEPINVSVVAFSMHNQGNNLKITPEQADEKGMENSNSLRN